MYIYSICDIFYGFVNTIEKYGILFNLNLIFYIYICKAPSMLYSWVLWCVWALFPLFDSNYVKAFLILLLFITILFTLMMAYDYIICITIFITISLIIQHIYDKQSN